jgi:hypothetical protein
VIPLVHTSPAYVSRIRYEEPHVVPTCAETPGPDQEYLEGSFWVHTITGGPSEFSIVQQVTFNVPVQLPSPKHKLVLDYADGRRPQTKPLGQTSLYPLKMLRW